MIVFVHLLNDRTGSPRVLKTVIEGLGDLEPAMLFLGSDGDGFLSTAAVPTRRYWYRRTGNRALTLVTFFISQAALILSLLRARLPRDTVIYVNTLLPFGAALFGRLSGRKVVYHVHEVSLTPRIFQRFLIAVAKRTAVRLIYVSEAHRGLLPIAPDRSVTVPNVLDARLAQRARAHRYVHRTQGTFAVLMLASARAYKGVPEFISLAKRFIGRRDIHFRLVLSDAHCAEEFGSAPPNLTLLPPADDPSDYYASVNLILNLSRPDMWVETFGLTLIEGMAFGCPVIAPPVGGPAELVTDGKEGFLIDSRDGPALAAAVERLADDAQLCLDMSRTARARAAQFDAESFRTAIADVIEAARG